MPPRWSNATELVLLAVSRCHTSALVLEPHKRFQGRERMSTPLKVTIAALVVVLLIVGWRVAGRQCADEQGVAKVVCVAQHMD